MITSVKDLRARLNHLQTLRSFTENRVSSLENEIARAEMESDVIHQSIELLNRLSEAEVENGIKTYVSLLEEGLKALFPDQQVGLRGDVDKIRGKVSLRLKTTFTSKDGITVEGEGIDSFGGAVSTVQSLLLRISLILKIDLKPLLILDESFPAVDAYRTELLVEFLKTLCARLKMNILCITHNHSISDQADRSYRLSPSSSGVRIEKLK